MDHLAESDPRVYFAAERTFLAWIRTGLGLMGIGFAVSRFGLFLRELGASGAHVAVHSTGLSLWSGVVLVGLGVIVNLGSVFNHLQTLSRLNSGTWKPEVSTSAVVLALLLALIGVGMTVYLISVH